MKVRAEFETASWPLDGVRGTGSPGQLHRRDEISKYELAAHSESGTCSQLKRPGVLAIPAPVALALELAR